MHFKLLPAALLLLSCAACSSHRGEPFSQPLKTDSPQLAQGQKDFMIYCDKCHPGGDKGLGAGLTNKPLPAFMIRTQVRLGGGAMPSFPKSLLPDDRLDNIIAYIKALRKES